MERHEERQSIDSDLGFGSVVATRSRQRFLNRDGSFNVRREGLRLRESLSAYQALMTVSWTTFFALVLGAYVVVNILFAFGYVACGRNALSGAESSSFAAHLLECFFFSVHTFGTIGYGNLHPASTPAHILVTVESVGGLLSVALATAVVFARFSRPTAKIVFSENALIAPYRKATGFMFRIANRRNSQIINLEAKVFLSWWRQSPDRRRREFVQLNLERTHVAFFPLSWTVVHPIDETSPLMGVRLEDLEAGDAEFLVLLSGFDETFSTTVHARSSYKAHELVYGARFVSLYTGSPDDEVVRVDIRGIHEWEPVPLDGAPGAVERRT